MNEPMGLGFVEGVVFRIIGSTIEEQDEWIGSDDKATVSDRISYLGVQNLPWFYNPMCSCEAFDEHLNATAIMVVDDDGNNDG